MNPNLRHQVHYGTLQVHGNAATMNSNLQYGNAQSAAFFPSSMPNPKVYNQQASVMVNNQGFVAMNMDGFDAGQGQRIMGMQGTMAAQMQGAISMTANISPQFNNGGGGHSFNMANGTMIPGSMMSTAGNMMQSSPGNILQATPNVMQAQNNIPVMQTSNNMVQGPGNMMHFYKGMNPGMMNSPNGLPGMNFSPQNSGVLPSFSQLFGTCSPGSQFQNTNQQQVHQGAVINPGNAGGFENFVQNVVVSNPGQHVQQLQQQQQHPLGQTFVNVYNQRQPVNTNAVNVNHFTCMPYKQGDNVFMMTPANLNNKFNSTMPVATVASHARPDCRFSGPGSGTNPGSIHVPICQPSNMMDHSQSRQLVTQASTMVTTTVYSHANVTCSSVSSGPHSQCVQRSSQSNCGHNHPTSERAAHCALVSRPSSVSSCSTLPAVVSQCRTKLLDNGKQLMSSSNPVSLSSSHQDTLNLIKCNSESEIVLPTTTASSTITSTTLSTEGPVCPKTSTITVPFGWRRVVEQGVIIYYSPSDTRLQSSECVRQYLQSDGTCKCGLECPLLVDELFSFDAHVKSKAWEVTDVTSKTDSKKFCNHKRKTIAMATLKHSQSIQASSESTEKNNNEPVNSTAVSATSSQAVKKEGKTKKKKGNKNKSGSGPYDGVLVSQLLAQRDKSRTSVGRNSLHVPLSKELSSLIDAALGNTDSSSKKKSTDDTHKKDSHVDEKGESDVHKPSVSNEKTLPLPASNQTNTCSNVLKHEKRDPMDDLGPITCHVPGKLDFSLGRPLPNCQHMFNRSPMMSPGLPNNPCLPSNPSHNNPLSIQTSFGQDSYKNQRIFLQSPPCNTGPNTPCDVPMQMPGYTLGDQMSQGYSVDHGGVMIPDQMMNMQSPVRFPAAFNQNQQTGNPYHCGPPQHSYMPMSSIRNNLSAPWLEQSRTKPKRPRPKTKKKERRKYGERSSPCPNIDVRSMHIQPDAGAGSGNTPATMASFLDNPTAFLAHQTALVHNSMASTSHGLHSGGIVDGNNKNNFPSQALSSKGSTEGSPSDGNKKPILNREQKTVFPQPEAETLLTCKTEPQDISPANSTSTISMDKCTTNLNSQCESEDKKPPHTASNLEEPKITNESKNPDLTQGIEVKSDQIKDQSDSLETSKSFNTFSERDYEQNSKANTLLIDHVQKTDTMSPSKRKPSLPPKTKEPKNLKHTLKKPSGNFPASTLLSAAARAQLASQIQTHVNSKVYMKTNSSSPSSRVSNPSGCPVNNSTNCDANCSMSGHQSHSKNRFNNQKLNVSRNNKITSSPLITQCCLEDDPNKPLNGFNNLYGGMNQSLSHSQYSKEQSPIQMVQNVVASIDGKSDMFKTNLLNTGVLADAGNSKQKDSNPLLQELSMDMGKATGTVHDPAYKASLQHLVNQALLQQGLTNMNSLPLGGHVPLLGVGSGLSSAPVSGLAPLTQNNNLSQMIPTMGLTQPVIAQQPLLQLISTLNVNTNNPMLLSSPSLNSPNQNHIAGNLSAPQMMGVSISRAPNTDVAYGTETLTQTSTPVHINQPDPHFDQNYPVMDMKNNDDLKTSTGTLMDGINQNPATCPAQLVLLPQLQMPMVQMMGANQVQINSNCMEKNNINNINLNLNMTQMVVPGQATSPQNIGMFSPNLANNNLNLYNLQQMMNLCSATNVTTAQLQQLQCLQLQQQLLQQYMQTLINQLGIQGSVSNSSTQPEKQETVNPEPVTQPYSGEKNIVNDVKVMQNSGDKCPTQEEEQSQAPETESMAQDEDNPDNASTGEGTCELETEIVLKPGPDDHTSVTEESQIAEIKTKSVEDNCVSPQTFRGINNNDTPCFPDPNRTEESIESCSISSDLEKIDHSINTVSENNENSVSLNSDNNKTKDTEQSKSPTVQLSVGETESALDLVSNHIDHSYEGMAVECDTVPGNIQAGSSQTEAVTKSFSYSDCSTNHKCEDSNIPDNSYYETDCVTSDDGFKVCDGPTTGDHLVEMANGPPTDQDYRPEDTSSLDGLSSSEDEKIDEIFANHRGLKRVLRDNRDSLYDDEDSLDFDDKVIGVFPRNFNVGDLVWGQIRGFPSWPGKLVHENQVKGNPKTEDGKLWVKWFGDHTCTQVEPDKLKTLSEGLEAHHRARKKYRKGRKMNSHLESAIQEAMNELDRPTENVEPVSQTNRYVKGRPVKKRRTR